MATPAPARALPQLPAAALLLQPSTTTTATAAAGNKPPVPAVPAPAATAAAAAAAAAAPAPKPLARAPKADKKKDSTAGARAWIAGLKSYYREVDDFVLAEEDGSGEKKKASFPFASSLGGATAGGAAAAAAGGASRSILPPWAAEKATKTKKGAAAPATSTAAGVPSALLRRSNGAELLAPPPPAAAAAIELPSSPLGALFLSNAASAAATSVASASASVSTTPKSGSGVDSRPWVAWATEAKRPSLAEVELDMAAAAAAKKAAKAATTMAAAVAAATAAAATAAAATAVTLTAAASRPRRGAAADFFLTPAAQETRGKGRSSSADEEQEEEGEGEGEELPTFADASPSPLIMVEVDDGAFPDASPSPSAAADAADSSPAPAPVDLRPAFPTPSPAAAVASAVAEEQRRRQQQQAQQQQAGPRLPSTGKRVTRRRGRTAAHLAGEDGKELEAPSSPAPLMLPLEEEGEEEEEREEESAAAGTPSNKSNNNTKSSTNPARALGAALSRLRLTPSPVGDKAKASTRRKSRLGSVAKEQEEQEAAEKEEEEVAPCSPPPPTSSSSPPPALSPLHRLLRVCGQEHERHNLPTMDSLLARHVCLAGVTKCGEGTFGEAFRCSGGAVVKVVPFVASERDASAILAEAARKNKEWEEAVAKGEASLPDADDEDDIIDDGVIKTAAELLAEAEIGLALTSLSLSLSTSTSTSSTSTLTSENDENASSSPSSSSSSSSLPDDATSGFCATRAVGICSGPYSRTLATEWDSWKRKKGTENLHPGSRAGDARVLHAVFVADDGGCDLESALKASSSSSPSSILRTQTDVVSLLAQVTGALAAAEGALRFEHRDLHWGNVLLKSEAPETANAKRGAKQKKSVPSSPLLLRVGGRSFALREDAARLRVRLIDFTLSRCDSEGGERAGAEEGGPKTTTAKNQKQPQPPASYCDLSSDPVLFKGPKGEPQSETYRAMAKVSRGDWESFHPSTNALWVSYLCGILLLSISESSSALGDGDTVRLLRGLKRRAAGASSAMSLLEDEVFKGVWREVK